MIAPAMIALAMVALACAAPSRAASQARTTTVDLPPSYVFQPAAIEVTRGSTVTWTNHDNFTHSVQVQGQSDVHTMTPGQTAQITFDQPGTYAYVCTLHAQNMKGTVTVD